MLGSMEPMTHMMAGACLARVGFNRKAAYATLAMTLAAEAPDLDTLWSIGGPVATFQHHRGITHTLIGLPLDGLIVLGIVWVVHRWRVRRGARAAALAIQAGPRADQPIVRPLTAAPLRWGLLFVFALIASLSHILLDWTNNYGVRPFFPFNPRWYAGSFVFIFEPVMFAVLLAALLAPLLFGLIGSEVGARRPVFRGRGWAIFALLAIAGLWGWRWFEREAALQLASTADYGPQTADGAPAPPPQILRMTASPYPVNPFRWHTVVETPDFYQMAEVDTLRSTVATTAEQDLFYKPAETPATLAAKRSWLGHAYLDWSSWPLVTDMGPAADADAPPGAPPLTAVRFIDLRFLYDSTMIEGRSHPPLSGTVYLDASGNVARMKFGSRTQW
jgi:inner membrane protein